MKKEKEHKKECFYCGALISGSGRGDHMPIPQCLGGKVTVPCCESCHDMKDRFNFEDWSVTWLELIMSDLPKLSRETKIVLMKIVRIFLESRELSK